MSVITYKNKDEQKKALIDLIVGLRDSYISNDFVNEGGIDDIFKYGRQESEDQLSGISGTINGHTSKDIFGDLQEGLSDKDLDDVVTTLDDDFSLSWNKDSDCNYYDRLDYYDYALKNEIDPNTGERKPRIPSNAEKFILGKTKKRR